MGAGFVVWFTGLSGSGKSTLATLVAAELRARSVHVEILDGDEVRAHLSKGLGFSREDRDTNVRRIGFVAKLLARAGACAMTAAISPYRAVRDEQRRAVGRFVEVYCRCPVDVLAARDPKGLYEKALAGHIPHFTGVTDPYEEPLAPEVVVDTGVLGKEACVARVLEAIERLGYLSVRASPAVTPPPHGGELSVAELEEGLETWPIVEVSAETRAWLELAACGALSPVRGPLTERDATRVRKEARLESGAAWPADIALSSDGVAPAPGSVVRVAGTPLGVRVSEVWRGEDDRPRVAGSMVGAAEELARVRLTRDAIERAGAPAAGFLVRGPLGEGDGARIAAALPAAGPIVVVVPAGPDHAAATRSAHDLLQGLGVAPRGVVVEAPLVPMLGGGRDALLQALLLKNFGAAVALVRADPRDVGVLGDLTRAELAIDLRLVGP